MTEHGPTDNLAQEDVIAIASVLNLKDGVFVVGGQALNLWAERYASNTKELAAYGPFTSKDVDYFGYREAAAKLADALGGIVRYPQNDDATVSTAVVEATVNGKHATIDFIGSVLGVRLRSLEKRVVEIAVPASITDRSCIITIPIMHPVFCLQSRIANVLHAATHRTDMIAMRQLHAAPIVVREYILEALELGEDREASECIQEIFQYMKTDEIGRIAHRKLDIDPLDIIHSVAEHPGFDARFRKHNISSIIRETEERRKRLERHNTFSKI